MLERRADPRVQQHRVRKRHFGAGAHAAGSRHRRRLRPAQDRRRTKTQIGRGRLRGARMSLIGRLIDKLLTKGSITLLTPVKGPRTYGPGGGKHLTVRLTDRKVAFDILKSPSLAVFEAYMDARLLIDDGTILELLESFQDS